jgi:hypothetical protein
MSDITGLNIFGGSVVPISSHQQHLIIIRRIQLFRKSIFQGFMDYQAAKKTVTTLKLIMRMIPGSINNSSISVRQAHQNVPAWLLSI